MKFHHFQIVFLLFCKIHAEMQVNIIIMYTWKWMTKPNEKFRALHRVLLCMEFWPTCYTSIQASIWAKITIKRLVYTIQLLCYDNSMYSNILFGILYTVDSNQYEFSLSLFLSIYLKQTKISFNLIVSSSPKSCIYVSYSLYK